MRKAKNPLIGLLICLALVSGIVGGVYSYMFARTEDAANELTPAAVSCKVYETFEDNQKKSSITVQNTGKVDAYLRVRLVTYWVNDAGEIVAKPSMDLTVDVADGWLADKDNDTYYYKSPVEAGAETPNLLAAPLVLMKSSDGYNQVIEVFAEAIQAKGTTDVGNVPAVTDAWGVTVDTNGIITAVK